MSAEQMIETAARAVADAVRISIRPGGETMRLLDKGHTFHLNPDEARTAARAVIAAIHPTVSTIEELEALPIQSIVACMGLAPGTRNVPVTLVWQRGSVDNGGSDWCMPDTQGQITASDVFYFLTVNQLRQELTVLHIPGGAA